MGYNTGNPAMGKFVARSNIEILTAAAVESFPVFCELNKYK